MIGASQSGSPHELTWSQKAVALMAKTGADYFDGKTTREDRTNGRCQWRRWPQTPRASVRA
jgi:hypothetical protein